MSEHYVQRKASGYLGNAPIWWKVGDQGYTTYVENAKRFSEEKARSLVNEDPEKWASYPCAFIDSRLHQVFDMQDFHHLEQWKPLPQPPEAES